MALIIILDVILMGVALPLTHLIQKEALMKLIY